MGRKPVTDASCFSFKHTIANARNVAFSNNERGLFSIPGIIQTCRVDNGANCNNPSINKDVQLVLSFIRFCDVICRGILKWGIE